jgi:hypothetical protein
VLYGKPTTGPRFEKGSYCIFENRVTRTVTHFENMKDRFMFLSPSS